MEDIQIASALSAALVARIGDQRYELWFGSPTRFSVGPACLTIRTASDFVRDWLRQNFADDIRACCESILGHVLPLEFEVDSAASAPDVDVGQAKTQALCGQARECAKPPFGRVFDPEAQTRKEHGAARRAAECVDRTAAELTLAGFVVGASNEYAYRAAELTSRGWQQASPMLWCGPTGVGKTHLLRATVREYRRCHPRAAAVYLSAEQFTTGFVDALRGSGLPSFRLKCRGAELLAIDDVQFFVGKPRTLEELQHTIDALLAQGRQLLFASDRRLADLRALGAELCSRLAGGLVCEMEPPEFATRLGILQRLRQEMRLKVDDDLLSRVAGQLTGGVRELRGAMHRLQIMSAAYQQPISTELVEIALRELARQSTRSVRLADVEQAVCDVFGVESAQLRSDRKGRAVSEPRMLAMWLARKYTRVPWSEIGEFFGRRSHSTVISAHRRVERLISNQGEVGLNDQSCRVDEAIRRLETVLRRA